MSIDLKMGLVFSQVGKPRGRGKIERFFRTMEEMLLARLPGYAPVVKDLREQGEINGIDPFLEGTQTENVSPWRCIKRIVV